MVSNLVIISISILLNHSPTTYLHKLIHFRKPEHLFIITESELFDLAQPSFIWPQLTNQTEKLGVAQLRPSLSLK